MRKSTKTLTSILEHLEQRMLMSTSIESIDGSNNNLANPTWGSANSDLLRLATAAYADGIDSPSLPNNFSARAISNILNSQADLKNPTSDLATSDRNSLSDFGYAFGQFIDHDLDHTPDGGAEFDIAVDPSDPIGGNLPFTRSQTDPATGTSTSNPAQQISDITAYLDLSQVYGSSQTVAEALRTFTGGQLKTSPGNMFPYDNTTYFTPDQINALNMANDAMMVPQAQLFAAGDVRANENVELTALQTLFMRNHNAIASQLAKSHPKWTDEQLYQEARKLNIAEYQQIVYNGWLPAVLGPDALRAYRGYNKKINATIANEFSTVAFRFGHSLLSSEIGRMNNDGTPIADVSAEGSSLSLFEDFFDPNALNPTGAVDPFTGHTSSDIGPILKADASGVSEANDLMAIEDVRNLLFGAGMGGDDLMARDVQRGRDNGIPDYNTLRKAFGLPAVTSFAQITRNPTIQAELAQAYPGGVNTIDAFEGGLAEDHIPGSDLGPLFQTIIVNQFTRLRDGDRFFYRNQSFNNEEQSIIHKGNSLTKVIEDNTPVTGLQTNAFIFTASITGKVALPKGAPKPPRGASAPFSGLSVQLEDANGDVLATTQTDPRGNFFFNQLSKGGSNPDEQYGLASVGSYKVVLQGPDGSTMISNTMTFTTGDQTNNVNFVLAGPQSQAAPTSGHKATHHSNHH